MITNKDTPKLLYSTKTDGLIWKITLDDTNEIIAWENRTEEKKVSFYAYNFIKKELLLNNYFFEEEWLLGLNKVINGVAFINGFESEFSPVKKGIIAFDLVNKTTLWQNFSLSIHEFTLNGVIVFDPKIFPRKFQFLDLNTGNFIKKISYDDLKSVSTLQNQIIFPTVITGNETWKDSYSLNFNNLKIASYYTKINDGFNHFIEVKKDDKIVLSDILNENIQKLSFDSFFVWQNKLIYIKNKSEIVSYLV